MHYVVGVAGPVGGGKTSLVSGITRILGNATVIHMDDYEEYTTQPVGEVLELLKSGADYDVLKMGNLAKDLQSLKFGREVFSPTTQFPICPSKYIIFETQFGREHRATGQWIDLLLWILGKHTDVKARANTASSLELQTEHGIDILLGFESGVTGSIHLDYFQRPPARSSEFIGEGGRIEFEYYSGVSKLYGPDSPEPIEVYETPSDFDRNGMFINEIKSFFASIEAGETPSPSFDDGTAVVDVATKALQDAGIQQA